MCCQKCKKELKVGDIYYASGPGYEFCPLCVPVDNQK